MNRLEFETERLRLKSLTINDAHFLIELLNTEGWLRYIGERNVRTQEQAYGYLQNGPWKSYETYGFGLGRISLKHTDQPIGLCGFLQRNYLDYPDIGYALLPQFTGQGYAFEIVQKTVSFGFTELGLPKIQAVVLPTNALSIKLLTRLGFGFEKTLSNDAGELHLYGSSAG